MVERNEFLFIDLSENSPSFWSPPKTTQSVYQYDKGQKLKIAGQDTSLVYQIQYAVEGMREAINTVPSVDGEFCIGEIPNELLMQTREITAYVYIEDDEVGYTVRKAIIPIVARPMPSNIEYTPQELSNYNALATQLNNLIEKTEDNEAARNFFEEYNSEHTYVAGNKVTHYGSSYVWMAEEAGNSEPPSDDWTLVAAKGDDGIYFGNDEPTNPKYKVWVDPDDDDDVVLYADEIPTSTAGVSVQDKLDVLSAKTTDLETDTASLKAQDDNSGLWRSVPGNPAVIYPVPKSRIYPKIELVATQSGTGDPSPDNIRPILPSLATGQKVKVKRTGKNLWANQSGILNNYTVIDLGQDIHFPNGVSFSFDAVAFQIVNIGASIIVLKNATGASVEWITPSNFGLVANTPYTGKLTYHINRGITFRKAVMYADSAPSGSALNQQFEAGPPTPYEPYSGADYDLLTADRDFYGLPDAPVIVDTEAGTVTVQDATKVLNGAEEFVYVTNHNGIHRINLFIPASKPGAGNAICSHYKRIGNNIWETAPLNSFEIASSGSVGSFMVSYSSVDAFKAFLAAQYAAGTPVVVQYKLATPITIPITPPVISALDRISGQSRTEYRQNVLVGETSGTYNWLHQARTKADEIPTKVVDLSVQNVLDTMGVRNYDILSSRDLKGDGIFATAADFVSAIRNGDFKRFTNGDYWPVVLNGDYRDVGSYTCPAGTTLYSDTALTTSAGTAPSDLQAQYINETYCRVTSDGTKYCATADCLPYFVRTFSNAIFKQEICINPYWRYGDSGELTTEKPHVLTLSRDCSPHTYRMRKADKVWHVAPNPDGGIGVWQGTALYATFNDPDYGIIKLLEATELGPYVYNGANGNGMRYYGETRATEETTTSSGAWLNRGKLFLPTEDEVWGREIFTVKNAQGQVQLPVFAGTRPHISKGLGNGGSRNSWWSMSAYAGSATYFCYVTAYGYPNVNNASNAFGAPVGFIIA